MVWQAILMTIIALMALITGLGFIFNLLLRPLKEDQIRMEKEVKSEIHKI